MLRFEAAALLDVSSLQNWVNGNGCMAREETAFLTCCNDLLCLAPAGDDAVAQLRSWVPDKLIRFYKGFREVRIYFRSLFKSVSFS